MVNLLNNQWRFLNEINHPKPLRSIDLKFIISKKIILKKYLVYNEQLLYLRI